MKKVYAKRLLKLADFLEALDPEDFDYSTWCNARWTGEPSCGTTACALGWATAMPCFRRLGARMISGGHPYLEGDEDGYIPTLSHKLFGLNEMEHDHLFEGYALWDADGEVVAPALKWYCTHQQAAAHIRRFVELS